MQLKNLNYNPHQLLEDDWANDVSVDPSGSDICNFYAKKSIFITGATGFLGVVLVEKILRSFGDTLDTLYILCREKKGKTVKQRLDEIYSNVLYKKLEKLQPKFREKIVPIHGDTSNANLGISKEDRQTLTEQVSIIFHLAATVKFDEKLKVAVALNIKATRTALELARDCKQLKSFVHCSTAFSNCPQRHINEEVYEPFITPDGIVNIVDNTPEEILEKITPHLLGDWPNTYSFTKAIAESTVREHGKGLPVCIFRPSIVIATYQEPIRGWIDSIYGPTGIVAGAGLGLIQSLHCDPEVNAEMVPVDFVVNGMIAAAYKNSTQQYTLEDVRVYNYVSNAQNPITWGDFHKAMGFYGANVASALMLWVYNFKMNKYKYVHLLTVAFLHFLPALIADGVCIAIGKKAQLLKTYKKIHKFSSVISYFSTQEWTFDDYNVRELWNGLNDVDKRNFNFDIKNMDWDYHMQLYCLGTRLYLFKDDIKTLPQGKKLWKRFRIIHRILKYIIYTCLIWICYKIACPKKYF